MARAPKTDGEKKASRPVGPKTLYLIFKPGTPADIVNAVKEAVGEVTMNSRALIKNLQGGDPAPFLSFKVEVEKREGNAEAAS